MDEIKIGQVWQEVDPRYPETFTKTVIAIDGDRITLDSGARKTKAKRERFNGKRGGYRLIKDVS